MKKYLKPGVFILSLIPFLIITYKIFFDRLGPEPVKEITHHTGEWTLIFIVLTLLMTPLKRITKSNIWISFRRMLGLFVFFYATIHLMTYVIIDYRFDWQQIYNDVLKKKIYIHRILSLGIINSISCYFITKNDKTIKTKLEKIT